MSLLVDEAEIVRVSGGYKRPAEQLRELRKQGFWRARRSSLTGRVILEQGHYDAVISSAASEKPGPKLRKAA